MGHDADFDLQDFLPYMLNQAAEASGRGFQALYKARYGMLRTEWRVLFHLGCYGTMTAKDICLRADVHKTKVSRAVAALERRRFLVREVTKQDRRSEKLSLTKTGLAAYRELSHEAQKFNAKLTMTFDEEEKRILKNCLIQLTNRRS